MKAENTAEFRIYDAGLPYAADLAWGNEHVDGYFHTDLTILSDRTYLQLVLLPQYGPDVMRPGHIRR